MSTLYTANESFGVKRSSLLLIWRHVPPTLTVTM